MSNTPVSPADEPTPSSEPARKASHLEFPFRLEGRTRSFLRLYGLRPGKAQVRLDGDDLDVRFGFVGTRIPIGDIVRWDITGPYNWVRAIAVRHTLRSSDISFCSDARGAVRLWLRAKHHIAWVNADEVYLGVADLDGLAGELARRGIPGEDVRQA
jgi:hypothetical protein